jgi:hypothetical protein
MLIWFQKLQKFLRLMIKSVSQSILSSIFSRNIVIDIGETNESVDDSVLAAVDNGQAQFCGIDINTFAIRPAKTPSDSM